MRTPKILIVFIAVLLPFKAYNQSVKRIVSRADSLFSQQYYSAAEQHYQKAYNISKKNAILYQLAVSLFHQRKYKSALQHFKQLYKKDKEIDSLLYYYMGLSYKSIGKYKRSSSFLKRFCKKQKDPLNPKVIRAQHEIAANFVILSQEELQNTQTTKKAKQISFTPFSEMGFQKINKDSSLFMSNIRAEDLNLTDRNLIFGLFNGKLNAILETQIYPNSTVTGFHFIKEPSGIILSLQNKNNLSSSFYFAAYNKGVWGKMQAISMPQSFKKSSNIHPHYFKRGSQSFLLFASNISSGEGGYDLYIADYENMQISNIRNLGKQINSALNEISPSYDRANDQLFFASQWHKGRGGFDIFSLENFGAQYPALSFPKNIGEPYNSPYDDTFLTWVNDSLFFQSNRPTEKNDNNNCCNEVYSSYFANTKLDSLEDIRQQEYYFKKMNELLPLKLYFDNDQPNPHSKDTSTNESYVTLLQRYKERKTEFIKHYATSENKTTKQKEIKEIEAFFNEKLEDEYWKFVEFNQLLLEELRRGLKIIIKIKGYASPLNSEDYNIKLSKRRIQSIVNYYKSTNEGIYLKYITKSQLIFKSLPYGAIFTDKLPKENNTKMHVYSPIASSLRRAQIEIIIKE